MKDNNQVKKFFLLMRALLTGFIGGLFWSTLWIVMHYFNFTDITPKTYLLKPWQDATWASGWLGDVISVMILACLSIIVALIYYGLFKKISSIWIGIIYGCLMWVIFFLAIHPLFPFAKEIIHLSKETIVTTISLFILYGTFIGYSISFDYYDTFKQRAEKESS